jgi:hypothetical protein
MTHLITAYIDAASGGMLAALAAGGLAGIRLAVKSAWQGRRSRGRDDVPAGDGDAGSPDADAH